jgi:hypothetical protein
MMVVVAVLCLIPAAQAQQESEKSESRCPKQPDCKPEPFYCEDLPALTKRCGGPLPPTPTGAPCGAGQYIDKDSLCKSTCSETAFHAQQNVYSSNFLYKTTSGATRTCVEELVRSAFYQMNASGQNSGKNSFSINTDKAGEVSVGITKWADDNVVDSVWTYISGSTSKCFPKDKPKPKLNEISADIWQCLLKAKTDNYQTNKKFLNCSSVDKNGNYVNSYLHGQSTGWGGGNDPSKYNSTTPACPDGTIVVDQDCNMVEQSKIQETCGSKGITSKNYTSWGKSTPLSLVLDDSYDINAHVSIVSFPVNPTAGKSYWIWKGSEQSPLLVYDPEHTGKIRTAAQLFGNYTFGGKRLASNDISADLSDTSWANGFEALGSLDANRDGEIAGDELEPLALWFDAKSDGVASPGEVRSLASVGIVGLRYSIDTKDDINHVLISKRGFKRELNGRQSLGAIVDWSSEGAENHFTLLSRRLAAVGSAEIKDVAPLKPKLHQNKGRESALSEGTGVAGLWKWKLDKNTDTNPIDEGLFILGQRGELVKGTSLMQLPFEIPQSSGVDQKLMVSFSGLSGHMTKQDDGSVSLAFTNQVRGSVVFNEAIMSADGKSMKGSSRAVVASGGELSDITYSWTAKREE